MLDVRARFTDPGFTLGDIVGLFSSYEGVPPGEKILKMTWDEGNPSGVVQTIPVGRGEPRDDNLYDLEGVVKHQSYNAPKVTNPRQISGSVTLGVGGFAPVATYSTTVNP